MLWIILLIVYLMTLLCLYIGYKCLKYSMRRGQVEKYYIFLSLVPVVNIGILIGVLLDI